MIRKAWLALVLLAAVGQAHALTLVRDSTAQAVIYASPDVEEAASDLATYIEKISGARLPINSNLTPQSGGETSVFVGDPAVKAGLKIPGPTSSHEGYAARTDGNRLLIAGESPVAARFAVYHFLETLGCRWFMPGELGEVVPSLKTVEVPALDIRETPDFAARRIWGSGWKASRWSDACASTRGRYVLSKHRRKIRFGSA